MRTLRAMLVTTSLVACASACEVSPVIDFDAGARTEDAAGLDAPGLDAGLDDAHLATLDGGALDAGTPPSGWAPLPWEDCEGGGRTLEAGPEDYRAVLDTVAPGDVLRLRAGTYVRGLPLTRSGEEGRCIVIEALDPSARPRFTGSDAFNVIAVHGASWIKVRHLDLDGMGLGGFGVASQGGTASPTHHVVIEDLHMVGFGGDQQIVGISTKSPAWDWVIRGNTILGAGTGLYLGNSDGTLPFVRGLVELNTVLDPIGYCMQIKHQLDRAGITGVPDGAETIIRWNVFSKVSGAATGGNARPNLLLGHFPTSGLGANDRYLVYGNFFYDNPSEALLQAEGNLAIYANVLVNPHGSAIAIQPHNDVPRTVDVFLNTIVASGSGLRVTGGAAGFAQRVRFNAVFADPAISAADASGDVTGTYAEASSRLASPSLAPGEGLDLHPLPGALEASVPLDMLPAVLDASRDFEGRPHGLHAGAYAGPASAGAITLERRARPYR